MHLMHVHKKIGSSYMVFAEILIGLQCISCTKIDPEDFRRSKNGYELLNMIIRADLNVIFINILQSSYIFLTVIFMNILVRLNILSIHKHKRSQHSRVRLNTTSTTILRCISDDYTIIYILCIHTYHPRISYIKDRILPFAVFTSTKTGRLIEHPFLIMHESTK